MRWPRLKLPFDLPEGQRYITVDFADGRVGRISAGPSRPRRQRGALMYALILAGGKGERLRPLTDTLPKPLAPLDGKPILWYQVEWLKQAGVSNVIFLVGYRWEMVREYFGDGSKFGIKPTYSIETRPLGRGGAIRTGMAHIPEEEDTVIVLNGDIITAQDPGAVMESYLGKRAANPNHLATIMVVPMVSPYGLVDTNDENDVVGFREKVELPHWINAGVYVFNRSMGHLMPELGDHEVSTFPELAEQGQISAFKSTEFWRSIDSFKDLREAEEYIREAQLGASAGAEGLTP